MRNLGTSKRRSGFTITELVVSMTILGVLAAVLLPAVQQSRETARRAKCLNNLKQFGLSAAGHSETHGSYPNGTKAMWAMLPGLDQGVLYNQLNSLNEMSPSQISAIRYAVPEFVCPDDPLHKIEFGNSNYFLNEGTILHDNAHERL